ncbi:MAG: putative heme iron utilization protein [Myxococcota bacterium]|jgi:putative heme iron utilization protein
MRKQATNRQEWSVFLWLVTCTLHVGPGKNRPHARSRESRLSSPPRHDAPAVRQDPLYDPSIPTPTHAEHARTLAERTPDAALATLDETGHPYASVVLTTIWDDSPVLLVSALAAHTKNLRRDARCSVLLREATANNPLAVGRMSIKGTAEPTEDPAARAAFLGRHPDAAGYADFSDFGFWRVSVERIRYIGGFGRMSWVDGEAWRGAAPDPLDAHAARIIAHMNDDHADALRAYAAAFSTAGKVEDVVLTAVDRYGFEMSVAVGRGRRPVRVAFDAEVRTVAEARAAFVELVGRARERL